MSLHKKFRGAAHSKCNLNYKVPKDIPVIIHNASYDTHFIINQLAEEIWKNISLFLYQLRKNLIMDGKIIAYKLRFIDSFRFLSTSLSELADNISRIFNSIECKSCIEKVKINSECCFVDLKNNRLIYRCKECKEESKRPINELIEKFPGIYRLKKGLGVEFVKQHTGMLKQIINI